MSFSEPPSFSVLLDTTVLCGALLTNGINRKLLKLAGESLVFTPVLSRVCLMEFYKKALFDGLAGNVYEESEVQRFLDFFVYPILENKEAVNSRVGRHHLEIVKREGMPIGQALAEISGLATNEAVRLAEDQGLQQPLRDYDQQDVHVWVTAIQERCTYMVSSNIKRFPERIGKINRIRPGDFYHLITEGDL